MSNSRFSFTVTGAEILIPRLQYITHSKYEADWHSITHTHPFPEFIFIENGEGTYIVGSDEVTGLNYIDRTTNEEHHIDLSGVFVQIGLVPNTAWLKDRVELTNRGEIIVDKHGQTSMPGVFAAGDCTDSAYKQIIISMGSGATAALGAFDYLIRQ